MASLSEFHKVRITPSFYYNPPVLKRGGNLNERFPPLFKRGGLPQKEGVKRIPSRAAVSTHRDFAGHDENVDFSTIVVFFSRNKKWCSSDECVTMIGLALQRLASPISARIPSSLY